MTNKAKDWKWALDNNVSILCDEELFDDMLNDTSPMVQIAGYEYLPGDAFKKVDPIAYNCAVADFVDSLISDRDSGIVQLDDGTLVNSDELNTALETESTETA